MQKSFKYLVLISSAALSLSQTSYAMGDNVKELEETYGLIAQYEDMEKSCIGFQNAGHMYSGLINHNLQHHFDDVIAMFKSVAREQAGCFKLDASTIEKSKQSGQSAYNRSQEARMYKMLVPAAMTDRLIAKDVVEGCNAFAAQAGIIKSKFKDQNIPPETCAVQ